MVSGQVSHVIETGEVEISQTVDLSQIGVVISLIRCRSIRHFNSLNFPASAIVNPQDRVLIRQKIAIINQSPRDGSGCSSQLMTQGNHNSPKIDAQQNVFYVLLDN